MLRQFGTVIDIVRFKITNIFNSIIVYGIIMLAFTMELYNINGLCLI